MKFNFKCTVDEIMQEVHPITDCIHEAKEEDITKLRCRAVKEKDQRIIAFKHHYIWKMDNLKI